MAAETTAVAVNAAGSSPGIEPSAGQAGTAPSTPAPEPNSQAAPQATPSEQPAGQAGTPKRLFADLESAEREYKAIQSRVTKAEQAVARLGDLTQAEQRLALLSQLQSDPKFVEWARARLAEQETGSTDPETQKALEIVEAVAARKAQELIAPYAAQAAQARLGAVFQAMERKYGPEWKEAQPKMAEVFQRGLQAGYFAPTANTNVTLEFVDGLYKMVVADDPEYAAKQHAKALAHKHAASISATPGTAPASVSSGPANSMHEALARAWKEHGL